LLSVAVLCHRIAILNEGKIVECGSPSQIFGAPQHPYAQKLVAALPRAPFDHLSDDVSRRKLARTSNGEAAPSDVQAELLWTSDVT